MKRENNHQPISNSNQVLEKLIERLESIEPKIIKMKSDSTRLKKLEEEGVIPILRA